MKVYDTDKLYTVLYILHAIKKYLISLTSFVSYSFREVIYNESRLPVSLFI